MGLIRYAGLKRSGVVFADDMTGTNGAAWSGTKWTLSNNDGALTIQSNAGQLALGGTVGSFAAYARAIATHHTIKDCEARLSITIPATLEQYPAISIRGSGDWASGDVVGPNTGLRLVLDTNGNQTRLDEMIAGALSVRSTVAYAGGGSLSSGGTFNVRFRCVGASILAKVWSGTEPGSWTHTFTTTNTLSPGVLQVGVQSGASVALRTDSIDNVLVVAA